MFSTAGRTVKSGLVASAVVSSWTWAATLLQSTSVAFRYGVSGPLWYAAGASVQILLFATVAIELKRRAPNAHVSSFSLVTASSDAYTYQTFLEAVRARYGTATHFVYIIFGLFTNILVTAMLLTGGAAVVSSLTGVPTAAACFLLPLGVVIYTMFGGIKATFLTDYVHTVILLVIILTFAFTTYATGDRLGSPRAVYDRLQELSAHSPVEGNAGGSYLTMKSKEGAIFFVINIIGNFGTVFMDNGCKSTDNTSVVQRVLTTCRLQQSHRRVACTRTSRLHHRRTSMVCHSLAVRDHYGTCCTLSPID
jgi:Na+/proline symporter